MADCFCLVSDGACRVSHSQMYVLALLILYASNKQASVFVALELQAFVRMTLSTNA